MDTLQPIAAIVLVLALLAGVLVLMKRRGKATFRLPGVSGTSARRLELVERISLGPQHALHLVRAGGRLLLVGTAPNSCQLLDAAISEETRP